MSNNVVVKVQVEALSKFGYKDAEGYVSYSKNCTDHDKALVVPGAAFEAEIYTAPSGARYLNKIVARSAHVEAPKATATVPAATLNKLPVSPDTERAKKFTPKYEKKADTTSAGLSKDEWLEKDKRITRCGNIQVAVQVMGDFDKAVELANKMFSYVFQEGK